ncbi:MAG: methyltransferase domain-containing protein [Planctomycetes bacterium]|nr:methyltransferase domain-containing protein [Planctomycetota bacterium]
MATETPVRDLIDFETREGRMRYLEQAFRTHLEGRVLDVGCDVRTLAKLRPELDYVGVDAGGTPDLTIDLEKSPRLPFEDANFDMVVCAEVLEHLDNLHQIFGELVRVTKKKLLISLPNCWTAARRPLSRGKGGIGHYGLPHERPADRHKWFFSLAEARDFTRAMAQRHGLRILETRVSEKPRPILVRALRRLRHPVNEHYLNLYAHTYWVLYERADSR